MFLHQLTPSLQFALLNQDLVTLPRLPLSLPVKTIASSSRRILLPCFSTPHRYFWGQGHDLHELIRTQFTSHRAEDTSTDRLMVVVQQHSRVAVETDDRTILTANAFSGANDHRIIHITFFTLPRGIAFDGNFDDVADTGVAAVRTTRTLIHITLRAPELSATSSILCIWIV